MASAERKVIRISGESMDIVQEIADEREIDAGAAADQLIKTAWCRLTALRKYGKKQGGGKAKSKPKAKAKSKKAKSKKAKSAKPASAPSSQANGVAQA